MLLASVNTTLLSQDCRAKFVIYLDNQKVETDSVYIGLSALTTDPKIYSRVPDNFTTYLRPNRVYNIIITRPGYNKQRFKVDTNNKELDLNIYLSSSSPDCYMGLIKYNKLLNKCVVYDQ
jgi:hypothetical protein